ncbi:hypothetical protein [Aureimonas sp. AU40]|uniref:hypothetical protein n=1 Tax=Aureimonas sp. AU40 TaxID=1637747 RepID=UPI000A4E2A09|nr:hypothetical protein [Aureimonas sp. AU40]
MTATILSFGRRQPNTPPLPAKMPWQNQDLAELYRVRDRLRAAGLDVEVEAGVTDEGDPWFVYVQAGTDNVVVHIARIDSEIHVINCVTGGAYTGTSFREVSDQMLADAPLALSTQVRSASNVVLHPSAFLTAFVAAAIMLIDLLEHGRAEAATPHGDVLDTGHHEAWIVSNGVSHAETNIVETDQVAATGDELAGDVEVLHRRLAKEASVSPQSVSGASPVANISVIPSAGFSLAPTHAFLAEVPGMSASVTLAAGLLAAEFARSFASEVAHSTPDCSELTQGFISLIKAFVAVESAHAKAPELLESASAVALAMSEPVTIVVHGETDASHHVMVAETNFLSAAISVKPVADGWTEHALFAASETHKASAIVVGSSVSQSATQAATSSAETQRPAPASVPTVEAPVSTPVPAAQTATSAQAVVKAEGTKDGSALDLGWVISQLVKHSTLATDVLQQSVSDSSNSASKTKAPLTDSSSENAATNVPSDHSVVDSSVSKTKLPNSPETNAPIDDHSAVNRPVEPTIVAVKDGVATFQAGLRETVQYHAGTTLTIRGFVLGEDHLLFDGTVGDAMVKNAHADGYDLVLGDADIGIMRLVGVLADPSLPHAQSDRPAAA